MVNVSTAEFCAKLNGAWSCSAKSKNTSSAMMRQISRQTNFVQFFQLVGFAEMPGRIIGVDDNHSTRALRNGLLQSMEIYLPAVIVVERIAHDLHVLDIGQKREKRIAGLGNQNFVAGIAERPKDE